MCIQWQDYHTMARLSCHGKTILYTVLRPVCTSALDWIEYGQNLNRSHLHLIQVVWKWIETRFRHLPTEGGLKWIELDRGSNSDGRVFHPVIPECIHVPLHLWTWADVSNVDCEASLWPGCFSSCSKIEGIKRNSRVKCLLDLNLWKEVWLFMWNTCTCIGDGCAQLHVMSSADVIEMDWSRFRLLGMRCGINVDWIWLECECTFSHSTQMLGDALHREELLVKKSVKWGTLNKCRK